MINQNKEKVIYFVQICPRFNLFVLVKILLTSNTHNFLPTYKLDLKQNSTYISPQSIKKI